MSQTAVRGKPCKSVNNPKHPLYKKKFGALPVAKNDLPQDQARLLMPPGSFIWRANTTGCWRFNMPGLRFQGQAAWSRFGGDSYLAMLHCVKRCWVRFLEYHQLPIEHCPIVGLLGGVV